MWETKTRAYRPGKLEVHRTRSYKERSEAEDCFLIEVVDENWQKISAHHFKPFQRAEQPRVEEQIKANGWHKLRVWRVR